MAFKLFDSTFLGHIALNRFVRSATWEGMAHEDGACTPALVEVIRELAKGEIGLIISSHAFVSPEGQAGPRQLAIHDDRFISGLSRMAEAAHDGGSKIVLQLAHAGVQADTSLTKTRSSRSLKSAERKWFDRSSDDAGRNRADPAAFVVAAQRAQAAGFDGVQIHAAHGYLLSQFLSPYFNRRTDEFGGCLENRARIVLTILEDIKAAWGRRSPC